MTHLAVRLLFPLCLACTLLVGFMPALGQRLPDRALWLQVGFSACDLPCWANITPGETPFTQVKVQLASVLPLAASRLLDSGSQVTFWTEEAGQQISGYFLYNNGRVGSLNLRVALPVGQLVRRLGAPTCIYVEAVEQGTLVLYWEDPDGHISIGAWVPMNSRQAWSPATLITSLWMNETSLACNRERGVRWLGFAPFPRYQNLLAIISNQ